MGSRRDQKPDRGIPVARRAARGHEVAIDLSLAQALNLRHDPRLQVTVSPSPWVFLLFTNDSPKMLSVTSNRDFQEAVRYGLDYPSLALAGGPGTIQAPGSFRARSSARCPKPIASAWIREGPRRAEGVRLGRPTVTLEVSEHRDPERRSVLDDRPEGAGRAGADRDRTLSSTASRRRYSLDDYVSNTMSFGWRPGPGRLSRSARFPRLHAGRLVGAHVGWEAGADPAIDELAERARETLARAARVQIFRRIQIELNRSGPFFPLIQPTQVFVTTRNVAGARFNLVYQLDITRTAPR